jgi:hypothetical protein
MNQNLAEVRNALKLIAAHLDHAEAERCHLIEIAAEAAANAPWMTEAHALCSDHGIAHGNLADRIRALRAKLDQAEAEERRLLAREKLDALSKRELDDLPDHDGF